MDIRLFAAAQAAAGVEELSVPLPDGGTLTLAGLQALLAQTFPDSASPSTAPLATLLGRCSFLVNAVVCRQLDTVLSDGDAIDVLPPFAGG